MGKRRGRKGESQTMVVKPLQSPLANSIHGKDARGKVQLLTKGVQGLRKGTKTEHRRVWGVGVKKCNPEERRQNEQGK